MLKKIFFYFFGVIFNGDNCAYDRYIWLNKYLPIFNKNERKELLDVGCGNGWALLLARKKGYSVTGLSFDKSDLSKIRSRVKDESMNLINHDVRYLDKLNSKTKYDVIVNFENIEHIFDYKKLMKDMSELLKNEGLIFITTPNLFYKIPLIKEPKLSDVEDGGHVIRGFTFGQLEEEANKNGLRVVTKSYISHRLSLMLLGLTRIINWKILKIATIPLTIIFNFIDNIFYKNYQNSLSVGLILQKKDN